MVWEWVWGQVELPVLPCSGLQNPQLAAPKPSQLPQVTALAGSPWACWTVLSPPPPHSAWRPGSGPRPVQAAFPLLPPLPHSLPQEGAQFSSRGHLGPEWGSERPGSPPMVLS